MRTVTLLLTLIGALSGAPITIVFAPPLPILETATQSCTGIETQGYWPEAEIQKLLSSAICQVTSDSLSAEVRFCERPVTALQLLRGEGTARWAPREPTAPLINGYREIWMTNLIIASFGESARVTGSLHLLTESGIRSLPFSVSAKAPVSTPLERWNTLSERLFSLVMKELLERAP